jgi:sugar lactone lactonase YvrE
MPIVIANPATPPSPGWDLASASYEKSYSVTAEDTGPAGFAFSTDGTKMYVTGFTSDEVHQYALSVPWDVGAGTTSFVQSFDISGQITGSNGIAFKPDGTKMYVNDGDLDIVHQYTLGTAWDISTTTYDTVSLSVTLEDAAPLDIAFSTDGSKMYMVGSTADAVFQYTLPTPWVLTGGSYASKSKVVSGEEINPTGVTFKSDGTVMYITGFTNTVYEYPLSVAWDVSTAGATSGNVSVSTPPETQTRGVLFKSDGTKMYTVGSSADSVHQFGSL